MNSQNGRGDQPRFGGLMPLMRLKESRKVVYWIEYEKALDMIDSGVYIHALDLLRSKVAYYESFIRDIQREQIERTIENG